jgi:hypothetical protein
MRLMSPLDHSRKRCSCTLAGDALFSPQLTVMTSEERLDACQYVFSNASHIGKLLLEFTARAIFAEWLVDGVDRLELDFELGSK